MICITRNGNNPPHPSGVKPKGKINGYSMINEIGIGGGGAFKKKQFRKQETGKQIYEPLRNIP